MAPNFDFDLLNEAIENAPTAGFGPSVTFGKCTLVMKINRWNDAEKKYEEREWDGVSKLGDGETFRLEFHIDVQELNPALTKEWVRRVDMKKSGRKSDGTTKNPKALTDWEETVLPSLVKAIGNDWAKKLLGKGVYVEVEEVDTVVLDKNGNPKTWIKKAQNEGEEDKVYVNSAPRFKMSFKSKAECQAAREERYGKKEEGEEETIPAKTIKDFQGLVNSLGLEEAMKLVESNNLFPSYEAAAIAVAAGFKPPF